MKRPEKSGRVKETAAPARIKDAGPFAPAENTATNTGKTMGKLIKEYSRATDWVYLALCVACSVLSVLTLISIGTYNLGGFDTDMGSITGLGGYRGALVQAVASLLGVTCAILLSCIDYRAMVDAWPFHVAGAWGLVALTFLKVNLGPVSLGYAPGSTDNYSWIRVGPLSLQPTELAKISFILTFAMHLDMVKNELNEPKTLAKLLAHMAVPVLLVHIQGDDGTAIVFACIGCMMMFVAGLSWRYIAGAVCAGVTALAVAVGFFPDKIFKNYQYQRIMALFHMDDPAYADITLQQNKGLISIGAGRIFGRGLFNEYHNYVPKAENDFIFSYIAESIGFVGCVLVLGALFAVAIKTLTTGLRSQDKLGTYICTGVFAAMAWQIIINLGMNLAVLPVIGVTLPFFSGGGTSALMMYLCVGLVLSVYMHNKKSLFDH